MEKKKYGMLQLDLEIHQLLKEYCKQNGFIMSTYVANLIRKNVKQSR